MDTQHTPSPASAGAVRPEKSLEGTLRYVSALVESLLENGHTPDNVAATLRASADMLRSAPPAPTPAVPVEAKQEPIELQGVRETIRESGGWWSSCSGCYETEDGHPVGRYPHSDVLGCALGSGCSDCGGIGAVWNHYTDEQVESMFREDTSPKAGTPAPAVPTIPGLLELLRELRPMADYGRVGTRDVDQARYQRAIDGAIALLSAAPAAPAPLAEPHGGQAK